MATLKSNSGGQGTGNAAFAAGGVLTPATTVTNAYRRIQCFKSR